MKTASPPKLPSFYVANPIKARECIYVTDHGNVFSTDRLLAGIPHRMMTCSEDAVEGDFLTVGKRGRLRKMTADEVVNRVCAEAV